MDNQNYFSVLPDGDSTQEKSGKQRSSEAKQSKPTKRRSVTFSDDSSDRAEKKVEPKRTEQPKKKQKKQAPKKQQQPKKQEKEEALSSDETKKSAKAAFADVKPNNKDNGSGESEAIWISLNPSKRWGELFFLYYSIVWIGFFGFIVVSKTYELCGNYGYTAIGLAVAVPCFLYPLLFPGEYDKQLPITQRYWFKANIWIAVITFIGNYFWTHYFYVVLKARYTFPTTWDLNQVPIYLYFITHAYFNTYHTFSNVLIRRFRTGSFYRSLSYDWMKLIANTFLIGGFSITVAFMEAFSISSVPYYSYPDKWMMYTVGSMFYGIYFYVSFPMFFRLDENEQPKQKTNKKQQQQNVCWTVSQTFIDALAACMLVTVILDLWRLALGPIIQDGRVGGQQGVPFVY